MSQYCTTGLLMSTSTDNDDYNLDYSSTLGTGLEDISYFSLSSITSVSFDPISADTLIISGTRLANRDPLPNLIFGNDGEVDNMNGFVSRFSLANYTLLDTVYIGGSGVDQFYYNTVDSQGQVVLVGTTTSAPDSYPVTSDCWACAGEGSIDLIIAKLRYSSISPTGPVVPGFEWLVLIIGISVYGSRKKKSQSW